MPLSTISYSLSTSSGLANIDLPMQTLDEESMENLKGKIRQVNSKLKKKREFHMAILANYEDETMQNMEETRYMMHLFQYIQKIQQCETLCETLNSQMGCCMSRCTGSSATNVSAALPNILYCFRSYLFNGFLMMLILLALKEDLPVQ